MDSTLTENMEREVPKSGVVGLNLRRLWKCEQATLRLQQIHPIFETFSL